MKNKKKNRIDILAAMVAQKLLLPHQAMLVPPVLPDELDILLLRGCLEVREDGIKIICYWELVPYLQAHVIVIGGVHATTTAGYGHKCGTSWVRHVSTLYIDL